MKKITLILTATLFLGLLQSQPANAEVCSTGTYTVAGINTFGDLPCSDPGTEINVTVRGLHDYGVPGGPTAYCSFIYVRKNLGTASSPNWAGSTDTVCPPKPEPVIVVAPTPEPVVTPTPTPEPVVTPTPEPVVVAQPTPEPVVANRVDIFKDTINNESITVFVSVSGGNQNVFSPEDTVEKSWSEIIFGSTVFPTEDNTEATVGVIEVTANSRKTESTTFEGRKTAEEVSSILAQKNLTLLQSKINKLLMLLDDWVK
jgi:hypothetical protein